jgi:serine/threonine protein kinase
MKLEIGKTIAGYEIIEVLGSSKTGVAYKVRNVLSQRFEVLKILPKGGQDNEEQTARFLREIKLHARLVHPNIVTFYNAREFEGQLVMTTEFVPGITVAERLESGPITWRDAIVYACQALSALEYAHANSIIHRGLTASSVVITTEGIARLTSFGIAKAVGDPQLTAVGSFVGALRYISPEQVKGAALDPRCDVYSLGVVLYEMLTGKLPLHSRASLK